MYYYKNLHSNLHSVHQPHSLHVQNEKHDVHIIGIIYNLILGLIK